MPCNGGQAKHHHTSNTPCQGPHKAPTHAPKGGGALGPLCLDSRLAWLGQTEILQDKAGAKPTAQAPPKPQPWIPLERQPPHTQGRVLAKNQARKPSGCKAPQRSAPPWSEMHPKLATAVSPPCLHGLAWDLHQWNALDTCYSVARVAGSGCNLAPGGSCQVAKSTHGWAWCTLGGTVHAHHTSTYHKP